MSLTLLPISQRVLNLVKFVRGLMSPSPIQPEFKKFNSVRFARGLMLSTLFPYE